MYKVSKPLGLILSELFEEPIFKLGLLIKTFLIITLFPTIQSEWFVPFIIHYIENTSLFPWSSFIESGGDTLAFPYGPIMLISHLPTTIFGWIMDICLKSHYFASFGFRLSLLLADIWLLIILLQSFENYWKKILIFYWLSPLVIFITYWHGQTDLIPVALFFYSLVLIKKGNYWLSGIALAFSIAAKHSMLIGLPFIFLYLWSYNGVNREFQRFLTYFFCTFILIEMPFFFSEGFRSMVLDNREVDKIYWLLIDMGQDSLIFLTPLIYFLLVYFFWRIRRINFELLVASMGVAFSIIILLTPSPPGWYLWLVPIFTMHQSRYGFGAVTLISSFSILFVSYHLLNTSGPELIFINLDLTSIYKINDFDINSIHYTLMVGFGFLISIHILREGIRENDYYRLGNKPIVLGIAGDSGVGKSTFSEGLVNIFGERSLVKVSGDDYHNWERSAPMWKTSTHLNPKANRLFEMVRDVQKLINGEIVKARHYDHSTGRFLPMQIKKRKDVILVEGLHTLYPKQLVEEFDLSFFLEMDEKLRVFYRINRDTTKRGHSKQYVLEQIEKRKPDSDEFIKPQSERANVVFTLLPVNLELLENNNVTYSNVKIQVSIKNGIYYQELVRVLIAICGLQVNIVSIDHTGKVLLEISGDVVSEDINLAVKMLAPHIEELLDFSAKFSGGINGIMQIITIMEINEVLKRRRS